MHLEGTTEVAVGRKKAWDFLIDPRNVAACVPGTPAIEKVDATHYKIRVAVGGGFLRATAVVDLTLTEAVEPERATISGSGGAMGGSVQASTHIALTELGPSRTSVSWAADVTLGGTIAGLGAMAEGPIRSQVDRTLVCVRERLESAG